MTPEQAYEWLAPKLSVEERRVLDVIYAAAKPVAQESEFDHRYLEMMGGEFVDLFRGQGATRNAKLDDALRRARSVVSGLEQVCGSVKRAIPHVYEERMG